MREDIDFCNFTAGQLGQKLKGRSDYERYYNGAETVLNMVPMPQGGATRRPGTLYVASSGYPVPIPGPLVNPTILSMDTVSSTYTSDPAAMDWANRRIFTSNAGDNKIRSYSMDTGLLLQTSADGAGSVEFAFDAGGNLFSCDITSNSPVLKKYSGATLAQLATFGAGGGTFTDPTTQCPPLAHGDMQTIRGDANYIVMTSGAAIYAYNTDTMTFAGLGQTLSAGKNALLISGVSNPAAGSGTLFAVDNYLPSGTFASFKLFAIAIANGASQYSVSTWPTPNPDIVVSTVATVAAASVDPAWTTFSAVYPLTCDQTDGHPVLVCHTTDAVAHQHYLIKLHAASGAVLWALAVGSGSRNNNDGPSTNTRIQYGTLAYYEQGSVYCIDTRAGTLMANVSVLGVTISASADVSSDDASGDIFVYVSSYTEAAGTPVPIGHTANAFTNLFARVDLAAGAGVGLYRPPPATLMASRLQKFLFSTAQAYMVEFTQGLINVYADDAVALDGNGRPIAIASPWLFADLPLLAFTQSADTLYIYHPRYKPRTLTRNAANAWTLAPIAVRDGPYLDVNGTTTTLTPSGVSGTITLTASSVVGINVTASSTGLGFQNSDIGRLVRVRLFSLWGWCLITGVQSPTLVNATVQGWVQNGGAYGALDGKAWAANTLYPTGAVVFVNANYYLAITGGVSGPSNGPAGTGSNLLDGTVTWSLAGPLDAISFRQYTVYAPGDIIYSNPAQSGSGLFYQCTTGGNTGGSSAPPVGTGTNITAADQNCVWESILAFTFPTATTFWALGKWYGADGAPDANYPEIPLFWQQRLMSLSTPNQPGAVEGSYVADFTNYAPTAADGTVTAANAVSWVIASDEVDDVRWAIGAGSSVAQQLGIGTSGGEWVMQPATNAQALGPGNVQVYQETKFGGAKGVQALRIGKSVLFADRSGRKLYDWIWQWALNGFVGLDRTVDADDITLCNPASLQGIVQMAWQQAPHGVIWIARGDGVLIGLTFLPDQKIIAWHQHQLGGAYNGGPPLIESVASIPSPDTTYDELWLVVRRSSPTGQVLRTVEVMTRYFDSLPQDQAWFADCALASSLGARTDALTYSALSGKGVNFKAAGGGFSAATVGAIIRVANGVAIVRADVDASNVTADWIVSATQTAPAGTTAWSLTAVHTSFTGLAQLAGQTVQVLGDGADFGSVAVGADGSFAIAAPGASLAIAGLAYSSKLVTMPWIPQRAAPVPATGKTKIIDHLYIRFYQSLGARFGQRRTDPLTGVIDEKTDVLETRSAGDVLGWAPPYVSRLRRVPMPGGFDEEGQIVITGSGPFPCTVLSIGASADVGST